MDFDLNKNNVGQTVNLKGWVKKSRRLGELVFFDLRNLDNIVQVVVESDNPNFEIANSLRSEFVIEVTGKVTERKNPNPNMKTGEIEIIADTINIINKAEQTPLIINDETDALEPVRMEYRYLDLRRPINQEAIIFRSKFNRIIREYFYNNDFKEIETPVITKSSPGGAKELKVISENHEGKEYALVQSPQIYKQLLMYGGIDKYFQIAKCFRDEDSRSDRQLEFTQLDLEISFTNEEEVQNTVEGLMKKLFKDLLNYELPEKFEKISYDEAMNNYGSDKPDTRFNNKLFNLTNDLKGTDINFISSGINEGKQVIAVAFEQEVTSGRFKKLEEEVKMQGASGLAWARIENNEVVKGSLKSLSKDEIQTITNKSKFSNFTVFMVIDEFTLASEIIGRLRVTLAKEFGLIDENKFDALWVVDWPMFEKNSEGKLEAVHNPFSMLVDGDDSKFMELNPQDTEQLLKLRTRGYDLVLNGSEVGGGAIRINNEEMQRKVFDVLGMSNEEIEETFGWFLKSQKFGIPYHGGLALGLDRIIAIMLKRDSIRDVIAFPKSTSGTDEMTKAPTEVK